MAQRTIIKLVDDLDNKEIEDDGQTVTFSYNGVQYEIDLSEKNAKKFDDALAPSSQQRGGSAADRLVAQARPRLTSINSALSASGPGSMA